MLPVKLNIVPTSHLVALAGAEKIVNNIKVHPINNIYASGLHSAQQKIVGEWWTSKQQVYLQKIAHFDRKFLVKWKCAESKELENLLPIDQEDIDALDTSLDAVGETPSSSFWNYVLSLIHKPIEEQVQSIVVTDQEAVEAYFETVKFQCPAIYIEEFLEPKQECDELTTKELTELVNKIYTTPKNCFEPYFLAEFESYMKRLGIKSETGYDHLTKLVKNKVLQDKLKFKNTGAYTKKDLRPSSQIAESIWYKSGVMTHHVNQTKVNRTIRTIIKDPTKSPDQVMSGLEQLKTQASQMLVSVHQRYPECVSHIHNFIIAEVDKKKQEYLQKQQLENWNTIKHSVQSEIQLCVKNNIEIQSCKRVIEYFTKLQQNGVTLISEFIWKQIHQLFQETAKSKLVDNKVNNLLEEIAPLLKFNSASFRNIFNPIIKQEIGFSKYKEVPLVYVIGQWIEDNAVNIRDKVSEIMQAKMNHYILLLKEAQTLPSNKQVAECMKKLQHILVKNAQSTKSLQDYISQNKLEFIVDFFPDIDFKADEIYDNFIAEHLEITKKSEDGVSREACYNVFKTTYDIKGPDTSCIKVLFFNKMLELLPTKFADSTKKLHCYSGCKLK